MKEWNVVLTSQMGQEHRLLREVSDFGEFHPSGFREVLIGKVPDPSEFLEILKRSWETRPFLPEILSTAVPVQVVFPFTLENLMDRLKQEALAFLPEIDEKPFYVRVKRRGHKNEISSQGVEQALDHFLLEELASQGRQGRIDFDQPELILFVELLHNQCGLTLITRDMKERYPFIKVK
jgi:tRNA(Ser,Leu) C12 N-acetylase TAN1